MRLSEAMMLGDSLRLRHGGHWLAVHGAGLCGCAIGGALLAEGFQLGDRLVRGDYPDEIRTYWPWLTKDQTMTISRDFNKVVAGEMTFEQMVDYVRSIEPPEDEEEGDEEPVAAVEAQKRECAEVDSAPMIERLWAQLRAKSKCGAATSAATSGQRSQDRNPSDAPTPRTALLVSGMAG